MVDHEHRLTAVAVCARSEMANEAVQLQLGARSFQPYRPTHVPPKRVLTSSIELMRSRTGATMVEFAILAMPFFLFLTAIFQVGLLFFEQETFQTAVSDASRLIFTGQASAGSYNQAQFKQEVCNRLPPFISCSNVTIDVRPYTSFSSATIYKPVDSKGNYSPNNAAYSIGGAKSIVVVSAYALQPTLFPMMNAYMSNAGNGQVLITASAAFRNEPWSS